MITIVLLQFFWLGFGLIGSAVFLVARRVPRLKYCKFLTYIRTTHPAIQAVLMFVLGLMPFVPIIVASYIFQWPLLVLTIWYVVILAGTASVVAFHYKLLAHRLHILRAPRSMLVLGAAASISLAFDYIVSLRVGGPLYGDAPVQLAKITFFKDIHFTLADPYYSNHGVVDPRYSTNLLDAFQALAASLLHLTAVKVWEYSYAFYRLLLWLSLFGLVWTYLGKKYRYLAYVVLAVMPFVWGGYFIFAELPDRIVLAWIVLFLIGLKLWLDTDSWQLLVAASLLTAMTHALYACMLLGYLVLLSGVLWISKTVPAKRMLVPLICALILLLPVGLNLYYPNRSNQDAAAFASGTIAGTPPHPHYYGPFVVANLPAVPFFVLSMYALFVGYIWFMHQAGRRKLRLFAYATAWLGVVFIFNANIWSLVGYGALIYLVKKRSLRIAVATLVCYYGVIVYNPIFWHFEKGKMPVWMIARFQELNVFGTVAVLLGLIFAAIYPLERWGYRRLKYVMVALIAGLFIWYFPQPTTNDYNIHAVWDTKNILFSAERNQSLPDIADLSSVLHSQVVYSNDPNIDIRVPGVVPANVYSFNPQNESPMTNIALRDRCSSRLAHSMQLNDLYAAGITRVITDPPYSLRMSKLAKTRPYLSLIAEADGYQVYAVRPGNVSNLPASKCAVPFGE